MLSGGFRPVSTINVSTITPKFWKKSETVPVNRRGTEYQFVGGFTFAVSESETVPTGPYGSINDGFTSLFLKPDVKL